MEKHMNIPENANYNAEQSQWELGERNHNGKPIGEWNYWWAETGHLCCTTVFDSLNNDYVFSRFHPDGTYSWKGEMKNDSFVGFAYYQKSKQETTELVFKEALYKNVFSGIYDWSNHTWQFFNEQNTQIDINGIPVVTIDEFAKNFPNFEITKEFISLINFEQQYGAESYSNTFALSINKNNVDSNFISTWSKEKEFKNKFMPFANANGMGSIYALWINESNKKLNELPVVVFGDEGGIHIVCENILQLLQLLTYDVELSVNSKETYFYKDKEEYEERQNSKQYRKWLKENFSLGVIKQPNDIIKKSQE